MIRFLFVFTLVTFFLTGSYAQEPEPKVDEITSSSALLHFSPVAGATQYQISYNSNNNNYVVKLFSDTSYRMTMLIIDSAYTARVRKVVEGIPPISWGDAPRVRFRTLSILSDPAIDFSNIGTHELDAEFTLINGASSYQLRYCLSGTSVYDSAYFTTSPIHITNLNPATSYDIQVRSIPVGEAPRDWSVVSIGSVTTLEYIPNPTFSVENITSGTADIQYAPVLYADDYEIQYYLDGTTNYQSIIATGSPFEITGLEMGSSYNIKMRTIENANATIDWENITAQSFTTLSELSDPIVTIEDISTVSANVTFTIMNGAESYDLRFYVSGTTDYTDLNNITSPYQISSLQLNTSYDVKVRSIAIGHTATDWSLVTPVIFSTLARLPDPTPTVENITSNSAFIQFEPVSGAETYQISYNSNADDYQVKTFTTIPYQLIGLLENTLYTARLRTVQDNPTAWGTAPRITFATLATNRITIDATAIFYGSECTISGIVSATPFYSSTISEFVPEDITQKAILQISNLSTATQNIRFDVDANCNISNVEIEVSGIYSALNEKFYRILPDELSHNSILELGPEKIKDQIVLNGLVGIVFNSQSIPFSVTGPSNVIGSLEIYNSDGSLLRGGLTNFTWDGTVDGTLVAPNGNYKYKIIINQDPEPAIEIYGDIIKNWQ